MEAKGVNGLINESYLWIFTLRTQFPTLTVTEGLSIVVKSDNGVPPFYGKTPPPKQRHSKVELGQTTYSNNTRSPFLPCREQISESFRPVSVGPLGPPHDEGVDEYGTSPAVTRTGGYYPPHRADGTTTRTRR